LIDWLISALAGRGSIDHLPTTAGLCRYVAGKTWKTRLRLCASGGPAAGTLGRVICDIGRRIAGNDVLQEVFAKPISLARRVRDQDRSVYSLHAPEVECIGKGKAHRPYEFGVKVSVTTPLQRCFTGKSRSCSWNQFSACRALPSSYTLSNTSVIASCTRRSGSFS
jgi:hypothetical protein